MAMTSLGRRGRLEGLGLGLGRSKDQCLPHLSDRYVLITVLLMSLPSASLTSLLGVIPPSGQTRLFVNVGMVGSLGFGDIHKIRGPN